MLNILGVSLAGLAALVSSMSFNTPTNNQCSTNDAVFMNNVAVTPCETNTELGSVEGYVYFESGAPAAFANVILVDAAGNEVPDSEVTASLSGRFFMPFQRVGTYKAFAKIRRFTIYEGSGGPVNVERNRTATVDVIVTDTGVVG